MQRQLGVTHIFITHDPATVRAIADDVVMLRKGSVVRQGKKGEVLSPPYDSCTELLISSVPEIAPDWLEERSRGEDRAGTKTNYP